MRRSFGLLVASLGRIGRPAGTGRDPLDLPKKMKLPAKAHKATRGHRAIRAGKLIGKLTISTKQTGRLVRVSRGKLKIES